MGRIIAIEISADAEYDITDRALKRFRRALYRRTAAPASRTLSIARSMTGAKGSASKSTTKLSTTIRGSRSRCRRRNTGSGAARLPPPGAAVWRAAMKTLDIAEAVNQGINRALTFIGLKVEQQPEAKKADVDKPAAPRGRFAAAVPLKATPQKSARKAKPPARLRLRCPRSLSTARVTQTAWRTAPRRTPEQGEFHHAKLHQGRNNNHGAAVGQRQGQRAKGDAHCRPAPRLDVDAAGYPWLCVRRGAEGHGHRPVL